MPYYLKKGILNSLCYTFFVSFPYFSKNGKVLPIEEAVIPLSSLEAMYGFGVYETLRVANGAVRFMDDHVERLLASAQIIELEHSFGAEFVEKSILDLVAATESASYNLKILLIGGQTALEANLYILCSNPHYPDKKLYREGVPCITYEYERAFPQAKTLNMLSSYIAYRRAKRAGSYDALLINSEGNITEGTRTNFFCITGKTIYTPPETDILLGVTRKNLLEIAKQNGYAVQEANISPADVSNYDGAFITSTSTKVVPIRSIDDTALKEIPDTLKELMHLFDAL